MLHKAWNSKGEVPYCFPRSSIKFQGHTGQNITDFDPNWAFPDYRPVAAFKSLRFALFLTKWYVWFHTFVNIIGIQYHDGCSSLSLVCCFEMFFINYGKVSYGKGSIFVSHETLFDEILCKRFYQSIICIVKNHECGCMMGYQDCGCWVTCPTLWEQIIINL